MAISATQESVSKNLNVKAYDCDQLSDKKTYNGYEGETCDKFDRFFPNNEERLGMYRYNIC